MVHTLRAIVIWGFPHFLDFGHLLYSTKRVKRVDRREGD